MSDRSVEDEMMAEVGRFSTAMRAAISRHAQAANWLERRKARKEISRLVRTERREADHACTQHKDWTSQAVNRYRIHAQTVARRANDPTVDHTLRARDAWSLAEHRADLARMFVTNGHLTTTERGIALDGLDAATVFPEYKTGNLFSRAHKVKGIEALRYRAQVARTQRELGIDRHDTQRLADGRTVQPHHTRRAAERNDDGLPQDQADAVRVLHQAQLAWNSLADKATPVQRQQLAENWRSAARAAERTGLSPERIEHEFVNAEANYLAHARNAKVPSQQHDRDETARRRREPDKAAVVPSELEALQTRLNLSIEHNGDLTDQNAQLTRQLSEVSSELDRSQEAWAQLHEREMDAVRIERDDARRERDELLAERESNAAVIQARAERDQLRAERDELLHERESDEIEFTQRDLETARRELEQVTAERDRLRGERDEAVQKLAERTPAGERYGSPERQAEQAKNTAVGHSPLAGHRQGAALAEAVARNGHDRGDQER